MNSNRTELVRNKLFTNIKYRTARRGVGWPAGPECLAL